ncbi:MAG: HAMP domain-containing histidine kinase, partial [Patescibacteria group bacterium]|nr:HAMP domain-containing histidine kinase [Patescibacteria group bacterium]
EHKAIGFRGVATNITRQKEIELRKDDFVSMASHELKTPLTTAKVLAQILQKQFINSTNERAKKFVNRINEQIDNLTDLVKDLLDVTRIQQGKILLKKENFSLYDLIKEVAETMQTSTNRLFTIRLHKPCKVYGDKEKIRQVLTNFITNAMKYSPENKNVIIRSIIKNSAVTIEVQDFGIGIPESEQSKIFEKFFQANHVPEERNTYPGLGLGLYISAEIIKLHNGMIGVSSVQGKGSTFYFTIPIK